MKLFLLERNIEETDPVYDCFDKKLIRAETEEDARRLANADPADEGPVWENGSRVNCKEILIDGIEEVVITDFHSG